MQTYLTMMRVESPAWKQFESTIFCWTVSKRIISKKIKVDLFFIYLYIINGGDLDMCGAARRSKIPALLMIDPRRLFRTEKA